MNYAKTSLFLGIGLLVVLLASNLAGCAGQLPTPNAVSPGVTIEASQSNPFGQSETVLSRAPEPAPVQVDPREAEDSYVAVLAKHGDGPIDILCDVLELHGHVQTRVYASRCRTLTDAPRQQPPASAGNHPAAPTGTAGGISIPPPNPPNLIDAGKGEAWARVTDALGQAANEVDAECVRGIADLLDAAQGDDRILTWARGLAARPVAWVPEVARFVGIVWRSDEDRDDALGTIQISCGIPHTAIQ